ncbi:hypothetical protein BJ165DRAFT_1497143 [Panaeolus papilionaceus]|nr:hypothetical protein BJ165DRAFT_1497143 [Panaeolus papilionaceus]
MLDFKIFSTTIQDKLYHDTKFRQKTGRDNYCEDKRRAQTKIFQRVFSRRTTVWSPVPHLHTSNDPPSEEETQLIRSAVEIKSALATVLFDPPGAPEPTPPPEIARLEDRILNLKTLTSSIRRIPPELLKLIFTFGMYPRPSMPDVHYPKYLLDYPWNVSQVCQRWRDVALSLSLMWAYLPPFRMSGAVPSSAVRRQCAALEEMIRRSRDIGIHVVITGDMASTSADQNPIIDILVKHSEKWESVALRLSPVHLYALRNAQGRIPNLRRASVWLWASSIPNGLDVNLFAGAPKLVDVYSFSSNVQLQFPRSRLSYLSFHSSGIGDQVSHTISSNIAHLEALLLDFVNLPQFTTPILLPKLKRFRFLFNLMQDMSGLNNFIVPVLEECHIGGTHEEILQASLALFQRSNQVPFSVYSLKKLAFDENVAKAIFSQPATLVSILELASDLQSLDSPLLPIDILTRLAKFDGQPLLPRLECLRFTLLSEITHAHACGVNAIAALRCELEADLDHYPLQSPSMKPLRCFVIMPGYGGSAFQNDLAQCQRSLEEVWGCAPNIPDSPVNTTETSPEEHEGHHETTSGSPVIEMLQSLKDSLTTVLPEPVSGNPSSELYISREQATEVSFHLQKCREDCVSARYIAASRIEGFDFTSLQRRVQETPDKVKKALPYLEDLEKGIKELLEDWLYRIDEQLPSIHWIYGVNRCLLYTPQRDHFRLSSEASNLVLDLDYILYRRFSRYERLMEESFISHDLRCK